MAPTIIATFGAEGGSCTAYGSQNAGVWSFWQAGSSMDFDENDDDSWKPWASEPVPNLLNAVPDWWWCMLVLFVHPDCEAQLHTACMTHRRQRGWHADFFHNYRDRLA